MALQIAYFLAGLALFGLVWFVTMREGSGLGDRIGRRVTRDTAPDSDDLGPRAPSLDLQPGQGAIETTQGSKVEPVLKDAPIDDQADGGSAQSADSGGVFQAGDAEGLPELDYEIEFVARVPGDAPVLRDEVLRIYRDYQSRLNKPMQIYGKDAGNGNWTELEKQDVTAQFHDLGASIQLADRHGPILEQELNRFSQMILTMGEAFNRSFRFSMDFDDALQQSAMLDSIGRRFDAMAVLNLVAKRRSGFGWRDFTSCMDDLKLVRGNKGIYIKAIDGAGGERSVLYHVSPTDNAGNIADQEGAHIEIQDIVMYMNVPTTPNPEQTFELMLSDAGQLQAWLDAKLVDHRGRTMNNKTLSAIVEQVRSISQGMHSEGLLPGSPITTKLF